MGEAMLFAAEALPDGMVALGPLRFESPQPVAPGPVEAAVRPEAWTLGAPDGEGLPGTVAEFAYLGSVHEVTLAPRSARLSSSPRRSVRAGVSATRCACSSAGAGVGDRRLICK